MKPTCKDIEVAGIKAALTGMRLPTKSANDTNFENGCLGVRDANLAMMLVSKGNVHGKYQRGIIAWLDINMPRYIWSELDTYTVGVSPTSSESTMYTLKKELANAITLGKAFDYIDASKLKDYFTDSMPQCALENFVDTIESLSNDFKGVRNIPDNILKTCLPEGWMQRRIKAFSYQALKNMYFYRKKHRLPEWQVICDCIEQLPYAEVLLFGCEVKDFKLDGE